jgi:hypothetical protein
LNILLISTYELGHQPFGLASPAAWLRHAGFNVSCLDLSREPLRVDAVRQAEFVAFYLPMHTATRLAGKVAPEVRRLNPGAHLCLYGLYAPLNSDYLRGLGAGTILGGEFEEELVRAAHRVRDGVAPHALAPPEKHISLARLNFLTPDRQGLPALSRYARLELPEGGSRVAGYTEASRGCKHRCRHCPVTPVYNGHFRVVPREIVLEDVRRQVEAGAQHVTFGDPDFFNGIRHAVSLITDVHRQFPSLTYDVTIKVEHLLKHSEHIRTLRETGCLFVTTAVESIDDGILARLEKGHTHADFRRVAGLFRNAGLALSPTFVAFTPWISVEGYSEFLDAVAELNLVEHVAPIQLGIRLLIPAGSRLLELADVRGLVGPFDGANLIYPWRHADSRVEDLYGRVQEVIRGGIERKDSRRSVFNRVRAEAAKASGAEIVMPVTAGLSRAAVPYLTEPWYCCAEPTGGELAAVSEEPQV